MPSAVKRHGLFFGGVVVKHPRIRSGKMITTSLRYKVSVYEGRKKKYKCVAEFQPVYVTLVRSSGRRRGWAEKIAGLKKTII